MIKQALAGVAVIGTVSGAALAQTYISMSPPPVAFVPPSVVAPRTPTTTNTAASSPAGDQRKATIQGLVDQSPGGGAARRQAMRPHSILPTLRGPGDGPWSPITTIPY